MKKRILALVLGIGICFGVTGCTHYVTETSEENINGNLGRFTILEDEGTYFDEYDIKHHQYLVYDNATYVIYVYEVCDSVWRGKTCGTSLSPFYCMNENNEPEIAVYWEGMEN